ncbi:MAG TPA: hypothetical protein VNY08_01585 [Bradyrhizobium sp.]|nr:hypothetical protein [Bradyrhizobium sp.]
MTEVPPSTAPPSALDRAATDASATGRRGARLNPRALITGVLFTVITGVLFVAIIGLAIWCLARPEPLLVQGESGEHADRHRRARLRPAGEDRGQPWSERRGGCDPFGYRQSRTGRRVAPSRSRKTVADAGLQRIKVGTRAEIIAQRKAEIDRAPADLTLGQQTNNRTKQLADAPGCAAPAAAR